MGLYRTINVSFWSDPKVTDDFTPEDRYFYLYLLTNTHTDLLGCYEISLKQMSDETGYTKEVIERLIKRFDEVHHVIKYDNQTKEMLILNWYKYNWQGGKQKENLKNHVMNVKSEEFYIYLGQRIIETFHIEIPENIHRIQGAYKGHISPMQATVPITTPLYINNNSFDKIENLQEEVVVDGKEVNSKERVEKEKEINIDYKDTADLKEIIAYLNEKAGKAFKPSTAETKKLVLGRLHEGYTVEQAKHVIDLKVKQWIDSPKMSNFLRPQTLFAQSNFENYINEYNTSCNGGKVGTSILDEWGKS